MFRRRRISRSRSGSFTLRLPPDEREILRSLPGQLRDLLGDAGDPAVARLFPNAYTRADDADAEREAEYQRYMRDELLGRRLEALAVVEDTVDADALTEEQLTAWLRVLNDIRLVLGTRLEVSEDAGWPPDLPDDDPETPLFVLYGYLSLLVEEAVEALAGGHSELG